MNPLKPRRPPLCSLRSLLLVSLPLCLSASLPLHLPASPQDPPKNSSHLPIYPRQEELIRRADERVRAGDFEAAVRIYDEALETAAHHVVPRASAGRPSSFVGVTGFIEQRLREWPKEGLAVWRRKHDPSAARLLEEAARTGDLGLLERIPILHPCTSSLLESQLLRASLLQEEGRSREAARILSAWLPEVPDELQGVVRARLALAWARLGEASELKNLCDETARQDPDGHWRLFFGRGSGTLLSFLQTLPPDPLSPDSGSQDSDWPLPAGHPSGHRAAFPLQAPQLPPWRVTLPMPAFEPVAEEWETHTPNSFYLPLFPVAADGILFARNEFSVEAFRLYSDQPDPLWSFRVAPPPQSPLFDDLNTHTLSVAGDRVFAPLVTGMGDIDIKLGYIPVKYPFPRRTLHAFDAFSGRLLWKRGGNPGASDGEDRLSLPAAPVPAEDRLYVGGVFQEHPSDPFEHHLLSLDAATGRTIWKTFVASGHTEINLFGNPIRDSLGSLCTLDEDRVYYSTNLGTIAALDRRDGRILWLTQYEQFPVQPTRQIRVIPRPAGWMNNAPVRASSLLIVTPTDSPNLYALEPATGRPRWILPRGDRIRYVYGAAGNTLVLGGEELSFVDLERGNELFTFSPPRSRGQGRGLLTAEAAWIPTAAGLYQVPFAQPAPAEFLPWPSHRNTGGNLLSVEGVLGIAAPAFVEIFPLPSPAPEPASLRKDPAARYRQALRLLQSNRSEDALREFESLRSDRSSTDPKIAQTARKAAGWIHRLHRSAARKALEGGDLRKAGDHLMSAAASAPDLSSEQEVVRLRSDLLLQQNEAGGAVRILQEFLERILASPEPEIALCDRIRTDIDEIIQKHGRTSYDAVERRATQELEAVRSLRSPARLCEFAARFPNSRASREALCEAAAILEERKQPEEAIPLLQQILRRPSDGVSPLPIRLNLFRLLEERGSFSAAAGVLQSLKRHHAGDRVPQGDPSMTVLEFVDRQFERKEYAPFLAPLPPAGPALPLEKAFHWADPDARRLESLPVQGDPPPAASRWLWWSDGKNVRALDPAAPALRWTCETGGSVRSAFFAADHLLILTDAHSIRLDALTGKVLERLPLSPPVHSAVRSGPLLVLLSPGPTPSRLLVRALDAASGLVLWSRPLEGSPAGPLLSADDQIAVITSSPAFLHLLESGNGRTLTSIPLFTLPATPRLLLPAPDRILIHTPEHSLDAFRIPEGTPAWKIPLQDYSIRSLESSAEGIFFLANRPDASLPFLARIDVQNGKMLRLLEHPALSPPHHFRLHEKRVWLTGIHPQRPVSHLRLLDAASFVLQQEVDLAPARMLRLPPIPLPGSLLFPFVDRTPSGRFCAIAVVVDSAGKILQNIRGDSEFEHPPAVSLRSGQILFHADHVADVYQ